MSADYLRVIGIGISTTEILIFNDETIGDWTADANTRNSNDAVKNNSEISYTKIKEVLLNEDLPACRIYFEMSLSANGGPTAFGKIYKNGVEIGVERSTPSTVFQNYSEDFSGFVSGDLIQIYAYATNPGNVKIQNMRFQYSKRVISFRDDTLDTPLTFSTTISVTNQDP